MYLALLMQKFYLKKNKKKNKKKKLKYIQDAMGVALAASEGACAEEQFSILVLRLQSVSGSVPFVHG